MTGRSSGPRPGREDTFGGISADYKLALNMLALIAFAVLVWISRSGRPRAAASSDDRRASVPRGRAGLEGRG